MDIEDAVTAAAQIIETEFLRQELLKAEAEIAHLENQLKLARLAQVWPHDLSWYEEG